MEWHPGVSSSPPGRAGGPERHDLGEEKGEECHHPAAFAFRSIHRTTSFKRHTRRLPIMKDGGAQGAIPRFGSP